MQTFKDSATGKEWAFEDDVKVIDTNGVYSFETALGVPLNVPTTLQPYTPPAPTAAQLLQDAKNTKIASLRESFIAAASAPVTDANGIEWNCGMSSALAINGAIQLAQNAGATTVDLWDYENAKHSLTIAEAQSVAAVVGGAYQTAYQNWQTKREAVNGAKTQTAVKAITW